MDETPWKQLNIAYAAADAAERERRAAAHLTGILPAAEADGLISSWWFIRKGPWRVRYLLADPSSNPDSDPVHALLNQGVSWTRDIYEPEIHAFGGPASMDLAHQLFHHDSRHLLPFLLKDAADRRERSLILCTTLMKAAGLDINEQGDVWARVAEHRTGIATPPVQEDVWNSFTHDIRHVLHGTPRTDTLDHDWLAAFEDAGRELRTLREKGALTQGIRAITALHVIFHWNRMGLPVRRQALLARAAKDAVFGSTAEEHSRPL
ncbi:thiopeptide-type bacteriocin biosynthesis protein [Saccharopolyspora sp. K220]|uniref:thiopeptide-type bacteriocin biosynthesis protein n=1 Tax=Saccharopolyspora soli TaxID=2926618 RepID=UPI001F596AD1|nr:thiopeptide-type bacteriocin biosynthesis protein [Saccharopolyspora soli]MCI2424060.1 thiopeptide-type bacteriocin biosynthesis protein [Saccharopolyspora soli]